jgi:hypothetical protein
VASTRSMTGMPEGASTRPPHQRTPTVVAPAARGKGDDREAQPRMPRHRWLHRRRRGRSRGAARDPSKRPSDDGAVTRRRAVRCRGGAAFGMRGPVLNGSETALAASSRRSTAASESPDGGAAGGWWPHRPPNGPCRWVVEGRSNAGQDRGRTPTSKCPRTDTAQRHTPLDRLTVRPSASYGMPPTPPHCAVGSLSRDAARDEHGDVPFDVERLLRLWSDPLPEADDAATDAFRQLYADPVTVNGTPLTAADMVARARAMQGALEEPEREVLGTRGGLPCGGVPILAPAA